MAVIARHAKSNISMNRGIIYYEKQYKCIKVVLNFWSFIKYRDQLCVSFKLYYSNIWEDSVFSSLCHNWKTITMADFKETFFPSSSIIGPNTKMISNGFWLDPNDYSLFISQINICVGTKWHHDGYIWILTIVFSCKICNNYNTLEFVTSMKNNIEDLFSPNNLFYIDQEGYIYT